VDDLERTVSSLPGFCTVHSGEEHCGEGTAESEIALKFSSTDFSLFPGKRMYGMVQ